MSYVVIEGNIGSGKSTLSNWLAAKTSWQLLHEPVDDNPILDGFYKDPARNAFAMQVYMLQIRAQDHAYAASRQSPVIMDRSILGGDVFANVHRKLGNINDVEWLVYRTLYHDKLEQLYHSHRHESPPFTLVYLEVDPEVSFERMRNRNRAVESSVSLAYLRELNGEYNRLIEKIQNKKHTWPGIKLINLPWNGDYSDLSNSPAVDLLHTLKRPATQGGVGYDD